MAPRKKSPNDPVAKVEEKADMKGKKCELESRTIGGKETVIKTCSGEPPTFTEEEAQAAYARVLDVEEPFEVEIEEGDLNGRTDEPVDK